MIYWINKDLIKRLVGRFQLETTPRSASFPTQLTPVVVPVTNADELLADHKTIAETADISAASGWTILFTVPDNKRWTIIVLQRPTTTANTAAYLYRAATAIRHGFQILSTTNALEDCYRIVMNQGDRLEALNTNEGGDAARQFILYYEEEDAY